MRASVYCYTNYDNRCRECFSYVLYFLSFKIDSYIFPNFGPFSVTPYQSVSQVTRSKSFSEIRLGNPKAAAHVAVAGHCKANET